MNFSLKFERHFQALSENVKKLIFLLSKVDANLSGTFLELINLSNLSIALKWLY